MVEVDEFATLFDQKSPLVRKIRGKYRRFQSKSERQQEYYQRIATANSAMNAAKDILISDQTKKVKPVLPKILQLHSDGKNYTTMRVLHGSQIQKHLFLDRCFPQGPLEKLRILYPKSNLEASIDSIFLAHYPVIEPKDPSITNKLKELILSYAANIDSRITRYLSGIVPESRDSLFETMLIQSIEILNLISHLESIGEPSDLSGFRNKFRAFMQGLPDGWSQIHSWRANFTYYTHGEVFFSSLYSGYSNVHYLYPNHWDLMVNKEKFVSVVPNGVIGSFPGNNYRNVDESIFLPYSLEVIPHSEIHILSELTGSIQGKRVLRENQSQLRELVLQSQESN